MLSPLELPNTPGWFVAKLLPYTPTPEVLWPTTPVADPPNPATPNCKSLTDGNQGPKSISIQSGSGSGAALVVITGIYTGTDATTIIVSVGGKSETATIVKLGTHPASLVYYLTWPAPIPAGPRALSVEAFDSTGASVAKPAPPV